MKKFFKYFLSAVGVILLLLIGLLLSLRLPYVQQKVTNYATSFVADKTGTVVKIDRLFVTFLGAAQIEGLYLEDQKQDTLLYAKAITVDAEWAPLLDGFVAIKQLDINGIKASIHNDTEDSSYNYQFLVDAFSQPDSVSPSSPAADSLGSSSDLPFSIAKLNLNSIQFYYADILTEMETSIDLGQLEAEVDSINVAHPYYALNSLILNTLAFKYEQGKAFPEATDSTSSPLPKLVVGKLQVADISATYNSSVDSLFLHTQLKQLMLNQADINLDDQAIQMGSFSLDAPTFNLQLAATNDAADTIATDSTKTTPPFEWPDWRISLENFDLKLGKLSFDQGNIPGKPSPHFDAQHLHYKDISLNSKQVKFAQHEVLLEKLNASLKTVNDAFEISQLRADLSLSDTSLLLDNFSLQTASSFFASSSTLSFPSLNTILASNFSAVQGSLKIKTGTTIDLQEAYYFAPELRNEAMFDSIAQEKIKLYGQLNGDGQALQVEQLYILYGNQSKMQASGFIKNWLQTDKLTASLNDLQLTVFVPDFRFLIPAEYSPAYPQVLSMDGLINYSPRQFNTKLSATLDQNTSLKIDALYTFNKPNNYHLKLNGQRLAIDQWLQDSISFSPVDLEIVAEGKGIDWPHIETKALVKLSNFSYQNQAFDTLSLNGKINNGQLKLESNYADKKLKYSLNATGKLDATIQEFQLNLNLDQLNLQAFNLTDSLAYLKTSLSANGSLDSVVQKLKLEVAQLSFADENKFFNLTPAKLQLINGPDSSGVTFSWEKIFMELRLNQPLASLGKIQLNQKNLMELALFEVDSTYGPVNMGFTLNASLSKDLSALLKDQLEFDTIHLSANYTGENKKLGLDLSLPKLRYNTLAMDSLQLQIKADTNHLELTNNIKKIESGVINIFTTEVTAKIQPNEADFNLTIHDEIGEDLFLLEATGSDRSDSLLWKINTETLVLNGEKWLLDDKNYFYFGKDHFIIRYMAFQRKAEKIFIETTEEAQQQGIHINFQDFNLGNLLAILNPEEVILDGVLNGDLKMADLDNPLDFRAKLSLDDILVLGESAGKLSLSTRQVANDSYSVDLATEGPVKMQGKAKVDISKETPTFDASLNLNELSLPFITIFSEGIIQEAQGTMAGDLTVSGTAEDFIYSGHLKFNDAMLFVTELNTSFSLPNETISLNQQTIKLNNFTVVDKQSNKMVLNGSINTENLINPTLDLALNANNFQLMNKEKKPDALYYGTAFIDAETTIKGTLLEPMIQAKLKINESTDFTYVVPSSTVDLVQMEGIVQFKNPYEALDSLKNKRDSTFQTIDISGIELNATIKTDKEAQFKVVVDERRGDYLVVSGESDLNLEIEKTGDLNLTGNYLVNTGFYQLSLYDLVKRKFEITSGSQVKWYGDPLEAGLNITANYALETSPNSLMVGQIVSTRKLPFIVALFINGSLSAPEISFGLDMPEENKGALGGRVYQQIQAINNNETELNKQVFSLLVLNQFFPAGSTGDGPDSEVLARNSASQILSNQLNKLSSQYIKGVDLNLDLDSYKATENGAAEQRTQLGLSLSKSLFDDRFKVQVGSQFELEGEQRGKQSASDILGNILIEYLLTEDGRYKLTGYRKNEYEGLIDGQVTVTGISVQFNKEFEKFSDLLNTDKNTADEE